MPGLVKSQADFSAGLKKKQNRTHAGPDWSSRYFADHTGQKEGRTTERLRENTREHLQAGASGVKQPKTNRGGQITATEKTQLRKWEWPVTFCCRGKHQRYVTPLLWLEWWWDDGWVAGWRDRFKLKRQEWSDDNWMSKRGTVGGGQDTKWAKYID